MIIAPKEDRDRAAANQAYLDRLKGLPWWLQAAAVAALVLSQKAD